MTECQSIRLCYSAVIGVLCGLNYSFPSAIIISAALVLGAAAVGSSIHRGWYS